MKSIDTFVNIATASSFIKLFLRGASLIVIPISTGVACGFSVGNKLKNEIIMQKFFKYKKQNQKDQQIKKSFNKLY